MMSNRQDEDRLLATMEAIAVGLDTWLDLATAPPELRRKRVWERLETLGLRLGGRYTSKSPGFQQKPPRLNAVERVGSATVGIVGIATPLRLWLALARNRAEHQRRLREWHEQRVRYRRLRYRWQREGFVGRARLLVHMVRLPRVASSVRWHAFSAGAAAMHGVICYYTPTPQSSSELRKRFPRYPLVPINAILLLTQLLRMFGLMPSSLWIAWPLRLATRAVVVLFGTLAGTWGGVHALRYAFVSPERLQRQHEKFQRASEQRRRKLAPKDRL